MIEVRNYLHRLRQAKKVYLENNTDLYNRSFSQEGEDMIARRLLGDKTDGYYVDIGAHHPYRFSNTQHFYERGWKGINVDAMPGAIEPFKKMRPRDTNVQAAVGKKGKLTFYIYDEPAINTFDKKLVEKRKKQNTPYKVIKEQKISIVPLAQLLDKYLPKGQDIDFMSIDVEGKDYEVLTTNDWSKYRPRFILIECHSTKIKDLFTDPKIKFLEKLGYEMVAKSVNTVALMDTKNVK